MTTYAITALCAAEGRGAYLVMKNPITTPRAFFERVVVPDIEALKQDPLDVRTALHASTSLHQLKEWVHKAGVVPHRSLSEYSEDLYARCPALQAIRDFASNAKHYPVDPGRAVKLDVGTTAMPTPTASGVLDVARQAPPTQFHIIAKADDGTTTLVVPVLMEGFDFWKGEFETNKW